MERPSFPNALCIVAIAFVMHAAPASAAAVAPPPRTRVSFDAEWRFLLGDPTPKQCNASDFAPLPATQCLGFSSISASSAANCFAACCATPSCGVWTWEISAGCWVGAGCSNFLNDSAWTGGVRVAPPGPTTCAAGAPCQTGYNDASWRTVRTPHDFAVEGTFDPALPTGHGALPRNVSWYRKSFTLPPAAAGQLVWLTFDGVYRAADVYINGAFVRHHQEGYTAFVAWLHNSSAPLHTDGVTANVVAVYVDGTQSELWSYEQAGIYRHVWLETAPLLSVAPWSFFVPSYLSGTILSPGGATAPQSATGATLLPQVDIANAGAARVTGTAAFSLLDALGALVCTGTAPFDTAAGGWARVATTIACGSPTAPLSLWNTAPGGAYLYTAVVALVSTAGDTLDTVSTRIGIRKAVFTPDDGFVLNGFKITLNGFSDHVGFGGCGGALPDRVEEFKLQLLLQSGGTAFRTAHNPVTPEFIDSADEQGVIIWYENRNVVQGVLPAPRRGAAAPDASVHLDSAGAVTGAVAPTADPSLILDCLDMIVQARNHPSIVIWSLCNELGCGPANNPQGGDIAIQFKVAIYAADTSRPITGNIVQTPYLGGHLLDGFGMAMDVTSFSHEYENVPEYHAAAPWKAVGLGESGSCEYDRGEYAGSNRTTGHISLSSGVIGCITQNLAANVIPYSYGSFSWTLIDYLGETGPWPSVSSHYGAYDLAGFAKDGIALYQAWWTQGDCSRVALSPTDWTAPVPVGAPISIYGFTCAPFAEAYINDASLGVVAVPPQGVAEWKGVFSRGNLTVVARDASQAALGVATAVSAGPPAALRLWLEPRPAPHNASALAADGAAAALLGVAVVDAAGVLCPGAAANVTFTIAGPAAVYGVSNGDPSDHSPVKGVNWRLTFHGLARAIIASSEPGATGAIAVTASADGLGTSAPVLLEAVAVA